MMASATRKWGLTHLTAAAVFAASWLSSSGAVAQGQEEDDPADRGQGAVPRGSSGAATAPPAAGAPAKPKLEMPRLLKFADAPYPPEAAKKGLEADVVLRLTIDKTGKVTDAEVVEAGGHGFDEAARDAALKFEFAPAKRNGVPFSAKILYRYSFTLKAVEPDTGAPTGAPPAPAAPKTGNLGGEVRMAEGNLPLAGAEVVITAPDGTETRLVTGEDGKWSVEDLAPGKYRVRVAASGFAPVDIGEEVGAGEATEVTYRLAVVSTGLEVLVQGERPPREVTRRTLERREIARIPGTSGDALRSIQSLPGVARPPGLIGLLIVRGSAPEDTETFVDGANVPLIYHFGGLSSVIPTELLERIDFYPGNFSAKYGRVMGGIVDVGLKSPNTRCYADYGKPSDEDGCYHGLAQVDLIDMRVLVQGPLGPVPGWTFAAGGRRSWIDTWLKPVLEEAGAGVTSAPVYHDYQVLTETKPDPDSKLGLRFFGSDDRFEILIKDPLAQDPGFGGNLRFGVRFFRAQALYQTELSNDVELMTMVSAGRDAIDFSLGTFIFELAAYPVSYRSEFGWKVSKGVKLNTGLDFLVVPFDVFVRAPPPPRPGEPAPGPFTTRPVQETQNSGTGFRPAWYTEAELTPTERARIVPGVRLDYARDSGHGDFSPRVNARYDLVSPKMDSDSPDPTKRALRTTLKGGVGMFHQPPQFQETDEVFGTPNLKSNRAIHYGLGVEQELTRQVEIGVEGFYKDMAQRVSRDPNLAGGFDYNNDGTGYVVGMETLLKYKPDKRFFGWLAYTLSRSIRKDGPDEPERLFQFDQTHNLTMLGSYRLARGWEFGARFRIISGPLTTPVLSPPSLPALYAADAAAYTPLEGEPFSERLPVFHQLDIRVDKRWQFRTWRLSAFLDVQNVYNNPAAEALFYNYNFTEQQVQTGLPLIPSLGMRGEF